VAGAGSILDLEDLQDITGKDSPHGQGFAEMVSSRSAAGLA
jgi:hypothetical protein